MRTITVRGTGNVSLRPDLTVVTMTLRTLDESYDISMEKSAKMLDALTLSLEAAGFAKDQLKTSDYNVSTEYESVRDENGNYRNVFKGYACVLGLKLEFAFDTAVLSKVLSAIAGCVAEPELTVRFTVSDKENAAEMLLRDASANAKKKAQILADASGVGLGELVSVDYSLGEKDLHSPTNYRMDAKCMAFGNAVNMDIVPEDVRIRDTVTFVWSIE